MVGEDDMGEVCVGWTCVSVSLLPAATSSPALPSTEKAYGWDLGAGAAGKQLGVEVTGNS